MASNGSITLFRAWAFAGIIAILAQDGARKLLAVALLTLACKGNFMIRLNCQRKQMRAMTLNPAAKHGCARGHNKGRRHLSGMSQLCGGLDKWLEVSVRCWASVPSEAGPPGGDVKRFSWAKKSSVLKQVCFLRLTSP